MNPQPPAPATAGDARDAFGAWPHRSILVVDDEPGMRNFLQRSLEGRCREVRTAASLEEAGALITQRPFDLVILDNTLPDGTGVSWARQMREQGLYGDIILITAFADLETAISALRAGVADFLLKPFRINQLLNAIARCFDDARLRRENFILKRELGDRGDPEQDMLAGLIGQSAALQPIRDALHRLAGVQTTVLITGESGTGKEVVARALHRLSPRASGHFVPINCGAVAPDIIESELFGHVKGAFSGAASSREGLFFYAGGGTLFLDEVGELPAAMQVKLLRVLEERRLRPVGAEREIPVDVRIIAATNRDLEQAVRQGSFREDLYYRLNVIPLHMPPLRERLEDVPALAERFVRQLAGPLGLTAPQLQPEHIVALRSHHWPGNVRELRNVIERWLILGSFPDVFFRGTASAPDIGGDMSLDAVEKTHILRVLDAVGGNKTEAARRLGVARKTLDRKFALWGLS
ncbi:sigma-54-dependent transcriptional regulator [Methyloversatilis universalis]|uniref:sigma-54-dependent transcriptional regulator n=1 Tax=Methyloversatilis universalis TaxID=378211 RepID=UPI000366919D|nr:sigma 54-interacting transcriptional regulator [Methyloversatilis universalis]